MGLEAKRPFPVEAGEQRLATLKGSEQLRPPRIHEHPRTAAMKQTVFVREGLQESRFESAGDRGRTLLPRLIEQVIEHFMNGRWVRDDL